MNLIWKFCTILFFTLLIPKNVIAQSQDALKLVQTIFKAPNARIVTKQIRLYNNSGCFGRGPRQTVTEIEICSQESFKDAAFNLKVRCNTMVTGAWFGTGSIDFSKATTDELKQFLRDAPNQSFISFTTLRPCAQYEKEKFYNSDVRAKRLN